MAHLHKAFKTMANKKAFFAFAAAVCASAAFLYFYPKAQPSSAASAPTINFVGGNFTWQDWNNSGNSYYQLPGYNFLFPQPNQRLGGGAGDSGLIIRGSNFTGSETVTIDGSTVSGITIFPPYEIDYNNIGSWTSGSTHSVTVTNTNGTATSAFTVLILINPSINFGSMVYSWSSITGGVYYSLERGSFCTVVDNRDSYNNIIDGWNCDTPAATTYLPYIPSGWTTYYGKATGHLYGPGFGSCTYPNGEQPGSGFSGYAAGGVFGSSPSPSPSPNQYFSNLTVNPSNLVTSLTDIGNGINCSGGYTLDGTFNLTACQPGYTATGDGICTAQTGTVGIVSGGIASDGIGSGIYAPNSVANNDPVPADWTITGPSSNLTDGTSCLTSASYPNSIAGVYDLTSLTACNPAYFTLDSVKEQVAVKEDSGLLAYIKSLIFPIANAFQFNDGLTAVRTLLANGSILYHIGWTPLANLGVSPSTLSFVPSSGSATITVANTGAPGSTLAWSVSGIPSWLLLSASSGQIINGHATGGTSPVTVSLQNIPVAPGIYTATLTFSGKQVDNGNTDTSPKTIPVTVTLVVPGSILVSSVDFGTGGGIVDSSGWTLSGNGSQSNTGLQQLTYNSEPAGNYTLTQNSPAPTGYAFHDIYWGASGPVTSGITLPKTSSSVALPAGGSGQFYIRWDHSHIVTPSSCLTFTAYSGGATPASQPFNLANAASPTATIPLNWAGTTSQPGWCTISPTSGTLATGANSNVSVSVGAPSNTGNLTCNISITDPTADNSPQTVQVCYNVSSVACGTANKTYLYTDSSYGSDTFCNPTIVPSIPVSPAFPAQGATTTWTCGAGTGLVNCAAHRNNPPPPICSINSGSSLTIPFSATLGSNPSPNTGSFTINNTGGQALHWSVATSTTSGGAWFSVAPASGTAAAGSSPTLTVTVASSALAVGTYNGTITISDSDGVTCSVSTVSVTLNVNTAPCTPPSYKSAYSGFATTASGPTGSTLTVTPSQTFYAYVDFNLANTDSIQAPNSGSNVCTFQAFMSGSSGTSMARFICTAPAAANTYTYVTGTNNYPAGSNVCASSQTLGTVTVVNPPICSINSGSSLTIPFSATLGSNPSPNTGSFTINNTGGQALHWSVATSTTSGGAWFSVAPASGTAAAGSSPTLTVTVASSALAVGTYNGTITVSDSDGVTCSVSTVSVTLNVTAVACTNLNYKSAYSGFATSASGPTGSTLTVTPSQTFYAFVDYGQNNIDSIQAPNSGSNVCVFSNWLTGSTGGNSMAVFTCTAPATPNTYTYVTGTNSGTTSNTCASGPRTMGTVTVQGGPYTLNVLLSGSGSGTVTSNPSGINCGSTCSASFTSGTSVTLTEAPGGSSTFAGWSGDCSGSATTCTVTMSAAKNVTATFNTSGSSYALTVTDAGSGSGTVTSNPSGINCGSTCSASFTSGTSVTLTEAPGGSSTFAGWSGDCSGSATTCTVTMSAAKNVTATFNTSGGGPYTLNVLLSGSGSGTVTSNPAGINCGSTCSASFTSGTSVTLTEAPGGSSTFAGWSGDCSGSATTCTVTMSAAHNATATFNPSGGSCTPGAYSQTVISDASNLFNSSLYGNGSAIVLTPLPNPPWTRITGANWIWDNSEGVPPASYANDTPAEDVNFAKTFTIPATTASLSGTMTVAADNLFKCTLNGTTLPFNVNAGNGFTNGTLGSGTSTTVSSFLQTGINTLSCVAENATGTPPNPAGFIYKLGVSGTTTCPSGSGPTTVTLSNNTCNQINLSWTTLGAGYTYNVYRSASNSFSSASKLTGSVISGLTYTDTTAVVGQFYYYWVTGITGGVETNPTAGGPTPPISPVACVANLGDSDKDIVSVNGTAEAASACNSFTDPLPANTTLNIGDNLGFQINLCNDQGQATTTSITVTDTMVNLQMPSAGWQAKYTVGSVVTPLTYDGTVNSGSANHYYVSGTAPNQTLTFNLTKTADNIAAGAIANLTFTAQLTVPSGTTATQSRFQNTFNISYNGGGGGSNLSRSTPWLPFYTGNGNPSIIEVP